MKGWLVGLALVIVIVASAGRAVGHVGLDADLVGRPDCRELRRARDHDHDVGPAADHDRCRRPRRAGRRSEPVEADPQRRLGHHRHRHRPRPAGRLRSRRPGRRDGRPGSPPVTRCGRSSIADLAALRVAAEANGTPIVDHLGATAATPTSRTCSAAGSTRWARPRPPLRTARPGHSEHQLGTAVDVLDPGAGELTTAFADTAAGQWVAAHAHEYGFVSAIPTTPTTAPATSSSRGTCATSGVTSPPAIHESGVTRTRVDAGRAPTPAG